MASPSLCTSTLLILSATLAFLAPSSFADYVLYSGYALYGGESLSYGNYFLTMQTDCTLVLYDYGRAVWSSNTYNKGYDCTLRMQKDGNLVIYDGSNRAIWATNSGRKQKGNYVLVLQPDRNVVIYGGAIWAAGSNAVGTAPVIVSGNSTQPAVVAGDGITMVTGK
ncbi:Mannose-specific lectin [Rhynchospora pubera]|uniref:non-specific serine/threonine protein kinase n=1 Tax=Rhynchospora pubera TaxID=906938 RepID=A0AAV8GRV9_9POAL|nr:Mannose-specific lectin [Rhynchospora pubera]